MNYIVIDHSITEFLNNNILDQEFAIKYPGATVYPIFAKLAREQGWQTITADLFLNNNIKFNKAITLSNEFTPLLSKLVGIGVKPGLLISGESPNVARKFYSELKVKSSLFPYANLFGGCLSNLHPNCKGYNFYWPCPASTYKSLLSWSERKILGMVSSFKHGWKNSLHKIPRYIYKEVIWHFHKLQNASLRPIDLYGIRLDLIEYFGPMENFVLRGNGWEQAIIEGKLNHIKFTNLPTYCNNKLKVLANCRFSLVIENCIYLGYVTEKIFDVFRAGSVPIYLGAPDISNYVPKGCFIDFRSFSNYQSLWDMLINLREEEWLQYIYNINNFLNSQQYSLHLEENVARRWLFWLEEAWGNKI